MTQLKIFFSVNRHDEVPINKFLSSLNDEDKKVLSIIPLARGNAFVIDLFVVYQEPYNSKPDT